MTLKLFYKSLEHKFSILHSHLTDGTDKTNEKEKPIQFCSNANGESMHSHCTMEYWKNCDDSNVDFAFFAFAFVRRHLSRHCRSRFNLFLLVFSPNGE